MPDSLEHIRKRGPGVPREIRPVPSENLGSPLARREILLYNITYTCRCDGIGRRSGLKIHRWRQRTGSSPVTGTTSPRTSYRSRRLFYKSHLSLILSRLLSKPQPLSLGCGLVSQIYTGIFFVNTSQSVASVISLAMSFFISLQSSPRAHFTAPRFQTGPAALGSGSGRPLCGRHIVRGGAFSCKLR